jgi:hypothetical protein
MTSGEIASPKTGFRQAFAGTSGKENQPDLSAL